MDWSNKKDVLNAVNGNVPEEILIDVGIPLDVIKKVKSSDME